MLWKRVNAEWIEVRTKKIRGKKSTSTTSKWMLLYNKDSTQKIKQEERERKNKRKKERKKRKKEKEKKEWKKNGRTQPLPFVGNMSYHDRWLSLLLKKLCSSDDDKGRTVEKIDSSVSCAVYICWQWLIETFWNGCTLPEEKSLFSHSQALLRPTIQSPF